MLTSSDLLAAIEIGQQKYESVFGRRFHEVEWEIKELPVGFEDVYGEFKLRYNDGRITRKVIYNAHFSGDDIIGAVVHENGGHAEFSFLLPEDLQYRFAVAKTEYHEKKILPTLLSMDDFDELDAHSEAFAQAMVGRLELAPFDQLKLHLRGYTDKGLLGLLFDAYALTPTNEMMNFPPQRASVLILETAKRLGIESSHIDKIKDMEGFLIFDASLYDKNLLREYSENGEELERQVVELLSLYIKSGDLDKLRNDYPNLSDLIERAATDNSSSGP